MRFGGRTAFSNLSPQAERDFVDSGSRIRDGLAAAVAFSMRTVANGLLRHPKNTALVAHLGDNPASASSTANTTRSSGCADSPTARSLPTDA